MLRKTVHHNLIVVGFFLLFASLIPAQQIVDEIIAKVNDAIITKRELEEAVAPYMPEILEKYQGEERIEQIKKKKAEVLDEMITAALFNYQARLYGFTVSESDIRTAIERIKEGNNIVSDEDFEYQLKLQGQSLDKLKEDLKRFILQRRVYEAEIAPQIIITESESLNYYNKNIDKFTTPEEVRISQLFFPFDDKETETVREEASQIRNQIKDANDFVTMAKQLSEGQEESQNGDLGFFKRGELLKEIEEVAFSLEVGEISPIIDTDRGFYIIQVTEKKPARRIPFEEISSDLRQQLGSQKAAKKMDEYIKELKESSYIEILRPVE
jgi:parvulin-like peptidyl-prolyl isomerase